MALGRVEFCSVTLFVLKVHFAIVMWAGWSQCWLQYWWHVCKCAGVCGFCVPSWRRVASSATSNKYIVQNAATYSYKVYNANKTVCMTFLPKDRTTRAHQEMRYPNATWRIMITYLPLNYDTSALPEYFLSNAHLLHIANGRSFTKNTFRVSLLSTFRVSSINYSLVCSLPIHMAVWFKLTVTEMTINWNKSNPLTVTVTVTEIPVTETFS